MKSKFNKLKRMIACRLIKKTVKLNNEKPVITFCFDDVPDSAITNGARILNENGYKGTFYVSLGISDNQDKNKSYFDHSKLKALIENGNELACHTYDHIKMYNSDKNTILQDLKKNEQKLNEILPGHKFENFSYPYGQQTMTSKNIIKNKYKSSRGVGSGLHVKNADLYNLHANALGNLTLQEAQALIDEAISKNAWLIFYTHEVNENPGRCDCNINLFQQVVTYCKEKQVECRTIDSMINKLKC